MIEINPLIKTGDGKFLALDAKWDLMICCCKNPELQNERFR